MHFSAHGVSHKGRVRETNADRFLVGSLVRTFRIESISEELPSPVIPDEGGLGGYIMVVADGIGSSKYGHEAASLVINSVITYFASPIKLQRNDVSLEDDIVDQFAMMIIASHDKLEEAVRQNPELKGMATTLTLAFVLGTRAWVAHVGDSRAYLVRGGTALRLTKDQTIAQIMVDSGALDEESAQSSRLAHMLASAVGGSDDAPPSVLSYRIALEPGDSVLLCTDGLTKHVDEETVGKIVSGAATPTEACDQLLQLSLDGGGSDNITIVVGRLAGEA